MSRIASLNAFIQPRMHFPGPLEGYALAAEVRNALRLKGQRRFAAVFGVLRRKTCISYHEHIDGHGLLAVLTDKKTGEQLVLPINVKD